MSSPTNINSEKNVLDFASKVWYAAKLDELKEHLIQEIDLITDYPEARGVSLKRLLARRFELQAENFLLAAGAGAAIELIAKGFVKKRSLILRPASIAIQRLCQAHKHETDFIDSTEDLARLENNSYDICWLSLPNTETGYAIERKKLFAIMEHHPETLFAIDTSYSSYITEGSIFPIDCLKHNNLILYFSVSKKYNLPGIRMAYLCGSPEVIAPLQTYEAYYPLSTIAAEAGRYIFMHPARFTLPIRKWLRHSHEMELALEKIKGVEILSHGTPYFGLKLDGYSARELSEILLERYQIRVRNSTEISSASDDYVYICARAPEENKELIMATQEIQESKICSFKKKD